MLKPACFFHVGYTRLSFDSNACFPIPQTCCTTFIRKPRDAASPALQILLRTCVSTCRQTAYQSNLLGFHSFLRMMCLIYYWNARELLFKGLLGFWVPLQICEEYPWRGAEINRYSWPWQIPRGAGRTPAWHCSQGHTVAGKFVSRGLTQGIKGIGFPCIDK